MSKVKAYDSESIRTLWRFAYMKLFDEAGHEETQEFLTTSEGDYRRLFWRFYWRES